MGKHLTRAKLCSAAAERGRHVSSFHERCLDTRQRRDYSRNREQLFPPLKTKAHYTLKSRILMAVVFTCVSNLNFRVSAPTEPVCSYRGKIGREGEGVCEKVLYSKQLCQDLQHVTKKNRIAEKMGRLLC